MHDYRPPAQVKSKQTTQGSTPYVEATACYTGTKIPGGQDCFTIV